MGIAAVAMAASMFAVDISAQLKFDGSLLDMSFDDASKASAIKVNTPSGRKPWDGTGIDLNVSADKAGAAINIDATGTVVGRSMWCKPADAVTLKLGDLDYSINKESIDWAGSLNAAGSNGVAADIAAGGLTINLLLNPGYDTAWFANKKVNDTAAYVKYGADFGTIGFAWIGTGAMKNHTISAGYNGTFGGVNLFTDAAFVMADKQKNVKADLFVKGAADAFGYAAYADFDFDINKSDVAGVSAKTKLTYALDGCTMYLYLKDANLLAKDFAMTVKPGVNFNIGSAAVEVAAAFDIAKTTKLSVPFNVKLGF